LITARSLFVVLASACLVAASPPPSAGMRALDVPGFLPAVLFVPAGDAPTPLVVATHGAGGTPEWECEYWRRLTQGRRFVLCLRGASMGSGGGYYYPNEHVLEAELVAAQRALHSAEPRVSGRGGLYAGFSQGASMGSAFLAKHGASFPALALIEGFQRWNIPRARAFAKSGGRRVLFACGTKECNAVATESARWLARGGIEARVELAPGAGHTPAGAVLPRVEAALPWLLGPSQ
jgi:poly(3-hydroxybutyrate) depolymerase